MKCIDCLYENSCILKDIAKDLTGCDGHSKERPPRKGEVKCCCCNSWIDGSRAFKKGNKHICFNCY